MITQLGISTLSLILDSMNMKYQFGKIIVTYLFCRLGGLVFTGGLLFTDVHFQFIIYCFMVHLKMKMRHSSQYQIEAVAKEAQQLAY